MYGELCILPLNIDTTLERSQCCNGHGVYHASHKLVVQCLDRVQKDSKILEANVGRKQ